MNIAKRNVVDGMLKNRKPFFVHIGGAYLDISVQMCPFFTIQRAPKLVRTKL